MIWPSPSDPRTILIVDDNVVLRKTLTDLLQNEGFAVYEAGNGMDAEAYCDTHSISLLITDIFMPEQDGLETIEKLHYKMPSLKIIAMSGEKPFCPEAYLRTATEIGAVRSLQKPFKASDLLVLVHEVLGDDPFPCAMPRA